jgi:hypothetical protein
LANDLDVAVVMVVVVMVVVVMVVVVVIVVMVLLVVGMAHGVVLNAQHDGGIQNTVRHR